ncbi:MAG: hypothetical protein Q4G71_03780 [Pseudomonadota bacterium]|nr:hypothetical protein [Pseudomonadota bacterium]
MTRPVITLKRGGSLRLLCQLQAGGVGVPVSDWQIDCWLRTAQGRLVAALAVTPLGAPEGRYELRAEPAHTHGWPLGELAADVRYRDTDGRVMHTCTFAVRVLDAITTPEP